ncbi:MAG: efflux RND transporter periplasmic adaptor subunit [Rhizomicrobium sp.]|nr:efflux RND transporter periplasmic adaptor subunit [Rhizomicrobium sp.]
MSPRTRLISGITILLVLVAAITFWALSGKKDHARPAPAVVTATAASRDVTLVEHTVGTVVANATVQVTAQVTGQLVRAAFQEGQIVKKGDLLFEIDPRPFQAALQQAQAQYAKDEAQRVSAVATQKRYDALFAQNAISSMQRDTADATAQSAEATVDADRAAVDMARLNLGYTKIHAPVDGKTGPILIQPGNLVSANGTNPLVVLTQIEPVKVSFSLPQSDLPAIQARDRTGKLMALVDNHKPGAAKLVAKVDFVSNQVSGTTGTIELRANYDNKDHSLVPGALVDVDVTLGNLSKATVVPREAVNDGPVGRYVFVVSPDLTAKMRPVTVLFDDGTSMAVKGIARGEKVVIDGQLRVLPGIKVQFAKAKNGPAKGAAPSGKAP